jgi:hypothetical protein
MKILLGGAMTRVLNWDHRYAMLNEGKDLGENGGGGGAIV